MSTLDSRSLRCMSIFSLSAFRSRAMLPDYVTTTAGARVALEPAPFNIHVREASAQREGRTTLRDYQVAPNAVSS